ncbi:hypothetical protein KFL_003870050 [Klebsormidium nitens]|uniref:Sm domain-containing protein n=1 Tax=Klebsormidium nitens TaxID=105231 RepID=A0A1Y1IID2_KLENI|nr:hypothetical protein KFL_003870050 [Klebsormidium nitens]|eukprot:GAQ87908.1 hypothetical protein KFL_003870050 [Klebsormidium nitens]
MEGERRREGIDGSGGRAAEVDPALDFFSELFDPLCALYTVGLQPPAPRVQPLDNLNKCRRIIPEVVPESLANVAPRVPRSQESIAAQQRAKAHKSVRLAAAAEKERGKEKILDKIAASCGEGPLALLQRCYAQRRPVQVYTRHRRGLRGTATGFLKAFDKFCNLVLQDVEESYSVLTEAPRTVWVKAGAGRGSGAAGGGARVQEERLFPKLEHRKRHLNQVFVRGDNVVLVTAAER